MIRLAAALLFLSAAAARAQAQEGCFRHQGEFPALIGGSPEAARAALDRMPGIRTIRVGGPETPMTRDYRPDRATVLVEGGVVRSITCG
ncbi:hypothetical protein GXW74_17080 [Roseomonas eburnea]|uniref:Peptidase inhibitor I78 family protein n=1 Tax=Neoroseomonas eburnea TaxID=1346889 RepID=A0A9X9XES2_9PROT|nr:hypothetical protein [Neoroseomonas eburnea]MBR0682208.1 hypothetical protein [Neoroseomonas eburnea]